MNRLATRLILAILAVLLLSVIAVPIAQSIAARQTFQTLPKEFRDRVQDQTRPPPFIRNHPPQPDSPPDNRPPNNGRPQRQGNFFSEENSRLLDFLSAYRSNQRRAIIIGMAGAALFGISLAFFLSRSIAKPIEAVSSAASRLSSGDLSARVELKHSTSQPLETQQLAVNFNAMAGSLESLEGERKAMIADIAHELRNPLATLQFRLDGIEDGVIDFDNKELGLLQGQVGLLSRLINDLRTLSLADAGRLSLQKRDVNVTELLTSVLEKYQALAKQQQVRLSFYPTNESIIAYADPDRLRQVMGNLLDNAFKVTSENGWIEVHVAATVNDLTISIKDSGTGIPNDELDTIFQRFVQGKRRDVAGKDSSGLGLAIVKTLVDLHNGRVKASNHEVGAQFDVILPID